MAGSERVPWQAGLIYPARQEVLFDGHLLRLTNYPFRRLRPVLLRAAEVVPFADIAAETGENEALVRRDTYKTLHRFLKPVEHSKSRWWLRPVGSVGLQVLEVPDIAHEDFAGTAFDLRVRPADVADEDNYETLGLENYLTLASTLGQFKDPHVQVTPRRGEAINKALHNIGSRVVVGRRVVDHARSRMLDRFGEPALAHLDFALKAGMPLRAAEGMTWIASGLLPNDVSQILNRRDVQLLSRFSAAYEFLGLDPELKRSDRLAVALAEGWRQKCVKPPAVREDAPPRMTPAEFDVLASFMRNPVLSEVAKQRQLSDTQVGRYLRSLRAKFGATTNVQLLSNASAFDAFAPFQTDAMLRAVRGLGGTAFDHFRFARCVGGVERTAAIGIALLSEAILPTHAPNVLKVSRTAAERCYSAAYKELGVESFSPPNRPVVALVRSWALGRSRPPLPNAGIAQPLLTKAQAETLAAYAIRPTAQFVARRLGVSKVAAIARVSQLLRTFRVRRSLELMVKAVRTGTLRPSTPSRLPVVFVRPSPLQPIVTVLNRNDVKTFRDADFDAIDLRTLQRAAEGYSTKDGFPSESAEKSRRKRLFHKTKLPLALLVTIAFHDGRIRPPAPPCPSSSPSQLTTRHVQCASGLARGLSIPEVAAELEISINTVKTHLIKARQLTKAKSGLHLAALCQRWGVIEVQEAKENELVPPDANVPSPIDGASGRRLRLCIEGSETARRASSAEEETQDLCEHVSLRDTHNSDHSTTATPLAGELETPVLSIGSYG